MNKLSLIPVLAVLFSACGSSNSSSDSPSPNNPNHPVTPPSGGKVVAGADLNALFTGASIESQFAPGLFVEVTGPSSLTLGGQIGFSSTPLNLNLTCASTQTTKSVSLGIFDHQVYSYTETTVTGGSPTFDPATSQVICGTPTTTKTTRVEKSPVPSDITGMLKILFATEANQTITYFDQGSTFVAYLTEHKADASSKSDTAVSLTFKDPRTTLIQSGLISLTASYSGSGTDTQGYTSTSNLSLDLKAVNSGTMPLTSLADQLKDVTLCDGIQSKAQNADVTDENGNTNCVDHQNVSYLIK